MKKLFVLLFVVFLGACSASNMEEEGEGLAVIGKETTNCNIIGVDSTTVVTDRDNRVGFNLEMEENIMTTVEEDVYYTVADTSTFALYDEEDNIMDVTFTLAAVPGSLDVPNLGIDGLENPASDTPYRLSIPSGSITCESGDKNSASYEVEFTLMASTIDHSACGDEQEIKCEDSEDDEEE